MAKFGIRFRLESKGMVPMTADYSTGWLADPYTHEKKTFDSTIAAARYAELSGFRSSKHKVYDVLKLEGES